MTKRFKVFIVTFILFLLCPSLVGQEIAIPKMRISNIWADHLGNFYFLGSQGLIKTDLKGKELARFSRPDLGKPDAINVYDPMRLSLHYKTFNQVLLLDNQLNQSEQALNLLDLGFSDVPCVALADDNFLWLYDQAKDKVLKMDRRDKRIRLESLAISQILNKENKVIGLYSNINGFLLTTDIGLLSFDIMGNFIQFEPMNGIDKAEWTGSSWLILNPEGWWILKENFRLYKVKEALECKDWTYSNGKIFLWNGKSIESLQISL